MVSPLECSQCRAVRAIQAERRREEAREAELAAVGRRHHERLDRQRKQAILEFEVPELYFGASLESWVLHGSKDDHLVQGRVLQLARRFLAAWPDDTEILTVLRGGPGTGKGHWVYSIAKQLVDQGVRVQVIKLADLIRRLRSSWRSEEAEAEESVLRKFRNLDLLCIDEVSRHAFYGQSVHQHLYDILDYRLEHLRPTIMTSNEDDATLAEILRPALWSRLLGHGSVVDFGTRDYRARER
jgi:DNA replication protein DnaC